MSVGVTRRRVLKGIGTATLLASTTGTLQTGSQPVTGCATIDQPGEYHLTENIDCLEITADRVRVDGRGYAVANETLVTGSRVSIANLVMSFGARITDARRVSIDSSRIIGTPQTGVDPAEFVIERSTRCKITNTSVYLLDSPAVTLRHAERNTFESCTLVSPVVVSLVRSDRNDFKACEFLTEDQYVNLEESNRNLFRENLLDGSGAPGFFLRRSDRNRFVENELDVLIAGFYLVESDRNQIFRNVVSSGLESRGATLYDSDDNRILHNDFCRITLPMGETEPVFLSPDSTGNVVKNVEC